MTPVERLASLTERQTTLLREKDAVDADVRLHTRKMESAIDTLADMGIHGVKKPSDLDTHIESARATLEEQLEAAEAAITADEETLARVKRQVASVRGA